MKRFAALLLFLCLVIGSSLSVYAGITHHTMLSTYMGNQEWGYNIYLPPGYETGNDRYPVIYTLNYMGGNENSLTFMADTLNNAIINKQVPPIIMVFPNGGRDTFYLDNYISNLNAESYIVKELIPYIDKNYRTISTREGRAIQGFSMGGWGSQKFAYKYPDMFCSVVAMGSGAPLNLPQTEDYPSNLIKTNTDRIRGNLRIRLVVGSTDPLYFYTKNMDTLQTQLNISHEYEEVPGVGHDPYGIEAATGLKNILFQAESLKFAISSPSPTPVPTLVPTPPQTGQGDLNEDGNINSTDLTLMKRYLLRIIDDLPAQDDLKAADLNKDRLINSTDYTILKRYVLGIIKDFPAQNV
ncbi:MAG: alpha/beta hydrolase-fold protein [Bacillota bacterium]